MINDYTLVILKNARVTTYWTTVIMNRQEEPYIQTSDEPPVVIVEQPNTTPHPLRLDRVLSSQPELGPSIPDGGYGWVVLVGIAFFYVSSGHWLQYFVDSSLIAVMYTQYLHIVRTIFNVWQCRENKREQYKVVGQWFDKHALVVYCSLHCLW